MAGGRQRAGDELEGQPPTKRVRSPSPGACSELPGSDSDGENHEAPAQVEAHIAIGHMIEPLLAKAADGLGWDPKLLDSQVIRALCDGLGIEWPAEGIASVGLLVQAGFEHWNKEHGPDDPETMIKMDTAFNKMFRVVVEHVYNCVSESRKQAALEDAKCHLAKEGGCVLIGAAQSLALNKAVRSEILEDLVKDIDGGLREFAEAYLSSGIEAIEAWETAGLDPMYEPLREYVEASVFVSIVPPSLTM